MKFLLALILLAPLHAMAQSDAAAASKKQLIFFNAANVGASIFNARASWYGANQCVVREELTRNPRAKFIRSAEISLPIDAAVAFFSWKLRKRRTQFSAGCF